MSVSWLNTQNIGPRQVLAAGLGVLLLGAWYFGWGTGTPSDRDKQKFIDWGFVSSSDGVEGFLQDGHKTLITKAAFKAVDSAECHRNTEGRRLFQKWQSGFPRYDCLYVLRGHGAETYFTALSAIYMPKSELASVGPYHVMYWAVEPDQRRLFALYDRELPKPAN